MKGIATMTPADFQSEYGSQSDISPSARPALHVVSHEQPALRGDGADSVSPRAAQRPQSGFLNQSIDEIARLYVESPFSW